MSLISKIEALIRTNIHLSGKKSNTGFYAVKCACCNDHSPRGGWKLEPNLIFYQCFNCGKGESIDNTTEKLNKKFKNILLDFGIKQSDIDDIVAYNFFNKQEEKSSISLEDLKKINLHTPEIKLPSNSTRITEKDIKYVSYLKSRNIDYDKYPFYINNSYPDRVIIPFYKQGKIIYWQARAIKPDIVPRYKNCEVPKNAILFNYDALFHYSSSVLFVFEGIFDALIINAVALIGSKLTEEKIEILKKSQRELVFVIDRDKVGRDLALKIKQHNLGKITFADKHSKDDFSKIAARKGKIFAVKQLIDNIIEPNSNEGTLLLNFLPSKL